MRDCFLAFLLHWSILDSLHTSEIPYRTTPEIIEENGYPAESHQVVTEDGFILTMHRIPYSSKSPATPNKPVVFLQHGLLGSSLDWLLMGPERSLGYLLADNGYDVWLGNCRGNTFSANHTTLPVGSKKYWDFSWHEMGIYDLPAVIDYILNKTREKRLYYVGMSMGTTMFFVLASERPEYNQKIRLMVAEAPIAFLDKNTSPLAGTELGTLTVRLFRSMGIDGFSRGKVNEYIADVCSQKTLRVLCTNALFFLDGYDPPQLNESMLPFLSTHYPAGASVKCFTHYFQLVKTGTFLQFDYGVKLNMEKYKQPEPPHYNLQSVTAPIALVYAANDPLSNPKNVLQLSKILPNCVELYRISRPTFTHFGFVIGIDVKTLVNDEVINIIKKY